MGVILVEGTHATQGSATGRLHLYHLSAVVGQQPGSEGAGYVLAQVKNPHAFKQTFHHVSFFRLFRIPYHGRRGFYITKNGRAFSHRFPSGTFRRT